MHMCAHTHPPTHTLLITAHYDNTETSPVAMGNLCLSSELWIRKSTGETNTSTKHEQRSFDTQHLDTHF